MGRPGVRVYDDTLLTDEVEDKAVDLREDALGDIGVVEILGRIDSTTAPTLGERLTGILGARKALVLDLRQLEYISSAGFRVLLLAAKHADAAGSRLVLCGMSPKVRQLFDLGGFLDFFAISASRDDAIFAVRGGAVCDGNGEVYGLEGAYVADASLFPASSGVNPMVTIMALARHVARGMIR